MSVINALKKGDLQRGLGAVNRELIARTRVATGADSDAMIASANELKDKWRELLGDRSEEPSAPGEPPAAKSRALQKSIGTAVVEGVRRVGSSSFVARLLETGVFSDRVVIEPRPHARPALELAAPKMTDVFVGDLQKKVAGGQIVP